jgi:hypothetical protein
MATPETIKKKLKTLFQTHFKDYLDTVENKAVYASDKFKLYDIEEYHLLSTGQYQHVQARRFPALFILDGAMERMSFAQGRRERWLLELVLVLELRHSEPETLSKMMSRYREAIWEFLRAYETLEGEAAGPIAEFAWGRSRGVILRQSMFQIAVPAVFTIPIQSE